MIAMERVFTRPAKLRRESYDLFRHPDSLFELERRLPDNGKKVNKKVLRLHAEGRWAKHEPAEIAQRRQEQ